LKLVRAPSLLVLGRAASSVGSEPGRYWRLEDSFGADVFLVGGLEKAARTRRCCRHDVVFVVVVISPAKPFFVGERTFEVGRMHILVSGRGCSSGSFSSDSRFHVLLRGENRPARRRSACRSARSGLEGGGGRMPVTVRGLSWCRWGLAPGCCLGLGERSGRRESKQMAADYQAKAERRKAGEGRDEATGQGHGSLLRKSFDWCCEDSGEITSQRCLIRG